MKYFKLLTKLIISALIIYIIGFSNYSSIKRDVYFRYHSKISFGYVLGFLPKEYKLDYDESIIYRNDRFDLINIVYNKFPNYHNYIIYNDIESNNQNLLKDSDEIFKKIEGRKDILSSQINLIYFNQLIKIIKIKNKDSISDYYCYLLSKLNTNSYKLINDKSDYQLLLDNYGESSPNKAPKDLIFDENQYFNFDDFKYYWFKDLGIFKLDFDYVDTDLKNVTDEFLGYLGTSIKIDNE
tara:strand:- start:7591 stop:8307 length:717 start_codon:yes stop_codon:yes gene_type:complete